MSDSKTQVPQQWSDLCHHWNHLFSFPSQAAPCSCVQCTAKVDPAVLRSSEGPQRRPPSKSAKETWSWSFAPVEIREVVANQKKTPVKNKLSGCLVSTSKLQTNNIYMRYMLKESKESSFGNSSQTQLFQETLPSESHRWSNPAWPRLPFSRHGLFLAKWKVKKPRCLRIGFFINTKDDYIWLLYESVFKCGDKKPRLRCSYMDILQCCTRWVCSAMYVHVGFGFPKFPHRWQFKPLTLPNWKRSKSECLSRLYRQLPWTKRSAMHWATWRFNR